MKTKRAARAGRTAPPPCSACGKGAILRDPRPSLADAGGVTAPRIAAHKAKGSSR